MKSSDKIIVVKNLSINVGRQLAANSNIKAAASRSPGTVAGREFVHPNIRNPNIEAAAPAD